MQLTGFVHLVAQYNFQTLSLITMTHSLNYQIPVVIRQLTALIKITAYRRGHCDPAKQTISKTENTNTESHEYKLQQLDIS